MNRFEIAAGAHRADVTNVDMIKFTIENPDNSVAAKTRLDEWHHFLMCTTPELKMKDEYKKERAVEKSIANDVTLGTVGRGNAGSGDRAKVAASPASHSSKHGEVSSKKLKKDSMLGEDGYHFNLQKQDDGSYTLSLFDLCRHVQIWAHQEATKDNNNLHRMAMCVVIVVTLIPFFTCIDGSYHVSDNVTIVFLAFTSFDCLFFLRTVFARFMMGAIIDYRRQFIMQRAFHDLLRTR